MKRLLTISIVFMLVSLLAVPMSTAYFSDEEISSANVFQAGEWFSCEVELTVPNGDEVYLVASPKDEIRIEWLNNFSDPEYDAKSNTYIKLWLSMDGGEKYVPAINGNTKKMNLEYFIWKPHPANNDQLKVKIGIYDNDDRLLCEDESDDTFTVIPHSENGIREKIEIE